jgi:ABC-type lipoprotein release transport system permease subunit
MYRLFLAIRYLLTRPINLLGMFGIALSVWALVVVVSLFSGFIATVEEHVHSASADVSVMNLPPWSQWSKLRVALADDPNIAAMAPRLVHYGLLHHPGKRPPPPPLPGRTALHGGDQPFLFVLGIDATAEAAATGFGDWVTDPAIPAALRAADPLHPLAPIDGHPTVLLGVERLIAEGLHPGDSVMLTTGVLRSAPDGTKSPQQIQIPLVLAGAYKTRHGGFDGNNLFVDIGTLQKELLDGNEDAVHEIAVRVRDESQLDATADRIARTVHRAVDRGDQMARGTAQTWREKNLQFLQSVEHQRALLKIVLIVIMVVAAFLMLATLSMMVTEKTSDIGILTAMGGTPLGVTSVFLACGLTITAIGVVFGIGVGSLTAIYLEEIRQALLWAFGIDLFPLQVYNLDRVPCSIDPWWLVQVAGMALGTGFVVSVLPALRAALYDPLVSLRGT